MKLNDGRNVKPVHIFLPDSKVTGKSHLVKAIFMLSRKHSFITVKTKKNRELFYLDLQKYQW